MKLLSVILTVLCLQSAFAANYGKFKLNVNTPWGSAEEAIFLLNSQGEIKFLENSNYFDIDVDFFFGEVTMSIETGGDEENARGILTLVNNKTIDGCAAYLDYKNEYGETMGVKSFNLKRWSKSQKKYVSTYSSDFSFSEACYAKLLKDYSDFEIF